MRVAEDIVPLGVFKAQASRVFRELRRTGRPVVITLNGKPAGVLMTPEEFDRFAYEESIREAIRRGEADAAAGREISDEEMGRFLDERFGKLR